MDISKFRYIDISLSPYPLLPIARFLYIFGIPLQQGHSSLAGAFSALRRSSRSPDRSVGVVHRGFKQGSAQAHIMSVGGSQSSSLTTSYSRTPCPFTRD